MEFLSHLPSISYFISGITIIIVIIIVTIVIIIVIIIIITIVFILRETRRESANFA